MLIPKVTCALHRTHLFISTVLSHNLQAFISERISSESCRLSWFIMALSIPCLVCTSHFSLPQREWTHTEGEKREPQCLEWKILEFGGFAASPSRKLYTEDLMPLGRQFHALSWSAILHCTVVGACKIVQVLVAINTGGGTVPRALTTVLCIVKCRLVTLIVNSFRASAGEGALLVQNDDPILSS